MIWLDVGCHEWILVHRPTVGDLIIDYSNKLSKYQAYICNSGDLGRSPPWIWRHNYQGDTAIMQGERITILWTVLLVTDFLTCFSSIWRTSLCCLWIMYSFFLCTIWEKCKSIVSDSRRAKYTRRRENKCCVLRPYSLTIWICFTRYPAYLNSPMGGFVNFVKLTYGK